MTNKSEKARGKGAKNICSKRKAGGREGGGRGEENGQEQDKKKKTTMTKRSFSLVVAVSFFLIPRTQHPFTSSPSLLLPPSSAALSSLPFHPVSVLFSWSFFFVIVFFIQPPPSLPSPSLTFSFVTSVLVSSHFRLFK